MTAGSITVPRSWVERVIPAVGLLAATVAGLMPTRTVAQPVITEFPVRSADLITAGPDGNLWFTEFSSLANRIGRITPGGVITEFRLPAGNSHPLGITAGPDGNLWFTEERITPAGVITGGAIGRITPGGGPPAPALTVGMNASAFHAHDTLSLTALLTPDPVLTPVDAYVALRLPNGSFVSLQLGGGIVPGIVPIATGFTPFQFTGELLHYTFTGPEPSGTYTWMAGLTQPGTLNVIGTIDQHTFTFGP